MKKIDAAQAASADKHDAYTTAHLSQAKDRITRFGCRLHPESRRGGSSGGGIRIILGMKDGAGSVGPNPIFDKKTGPGLLLKAGLFS
ncbi:MAG: hypothetical protein U0936_21485 [Planctomycetaceae bacterium]